MLKLILCVSLLATVCVEQTVGQRSLIQQQEGLGQQQFQQNLLTQERFLQPLFLARQLQSLSQQQGVLTQQDLLGQVNPFLLNEQIPLTQSVDAQAVRLEQQLRTLRRQQDALRARQEARLRVERRRQQDRATRLRNFRLQQEAIRRRQEELRQTRLTNADILQRRAELAQSQALLQQPLTVGQGPYIPIVEDERDGPFQDGTYYFKYATGNGIIREEGSRLTSPYTHEVTGSYSYTAPNGELIIMEYIADENGYRAFRVRPDRPSVVARPQPIPVPPPIRPPLPQFQGALSSLGRSISSLPVIDELPLRQLPRTKRKNSAPVINVFTGEKTGQRSQLGSGSEEDLEGSDSSQSLVVLQPPARDATETPAA